MDFKLDDSVNHRIATLAGLLKRQIFRIIASNNLDITPDQWVVLYHLWEKDSLTIGEIVERTNKDFANVTRIVDKLEKLAYVSKEKSTTDKRSYHVVLLPKADEIKGKIKACWSESMSSALQGVDEEEQNSLLQTILKIENNVLRYLNQ